jgi:hypothetical protein
METWKGPFEIMFVCRAGSYTGGITHHTRGYTSRDIAEEVIEQFLDQHANPENRVSNNWGYVVRLYI